MSVLPLWCLVAILATPILAVDQESSQRDYDELYRKIQKDKHFFMTQSDYSTKQEKYCRNSCQKRSLPPKLDECHCDEQCVDFGDCCLDYWESCNASFKDAYNHRRTFECVLPKLSLSINSTVKWPVSGVGYEIVVKCPTAFRNTRIKTACEAADKQYDNVLPFVQGSDGKSYRNQFCAECNRVPEFRRWSTNISCDNETMLTIIKNRIKANDYKFTKSERKIIRETCALLVSPPLGAKATACRMTKECSNNKSQHYLNCRLYKLQMHTAFFVPKIYKNPHCVTCNGLFMGFFSLDEAVHQGTAPSSLGVFFDFTKSSEIYGLEEVAIEQECKTGEIYDHQLKVCRKKRISNSTKLQNWTCTYSKETFPNSSHYLTVYNNLSVFVLSHNKVYKPGEYLWHDGNITVCGNLTVSYLKYTMERLGKLYTKAEFYITVVGLTLSIVSLCAVIVTYFLFVELRSKLPGKIVINLSIALMFAQIVFMFDLFRDIKGDGCVSIAVILQFLFLSAFCWMNVMAFDVSRTFAGKSHRSPSGSRNKVFMFCFIYAWGLPFLITGLTLIVNHTGAMNVAYGNNYYCWITNPVALAIFFVVPVVLMLLFNIIALVRVLVAVRRVRKVTKKVRDKSTAGQDARMCWKLTAVFGLTWILCLAAEHHIALRIIYIIFNSLQGVFIMVSFIMTKRVLNMYLTKAGRKPLTTSTAGSTQKSTLSRSEVSRKISSAPLVDRKASEKRRNSPAQAVEIVHDDDSPETGLISNVEGPETKL